MKLWKQNRVDREYTMTEAELAKNFIDSQQFKDWVAYGGNLMRSFLDYISTPEPNAIDSYIESEDVERVYSIIRKKLHRGIKN